MQMEIRKNGNEVIEMVRDLVRRICFRTSLLQITQMRSSSSQWQWRKPGEIDSICCTFSYTVTTFRVTLPRPSAESDFVKARRVAGWLAMFQSGAQLGDSTRPRLPFITHA